MLRASVLFVICFFLRSLESSGQETDLRSYLTGTWLVMESLASSEIESPDLSSYFRYEFLENDTVYYGTNEYERGVKARYRLAGNNLFMFGNIYTVERFGDGRLDLVLIPRWGNEKLPMSLVSKEIYDLYWKFASSRWQANSKPVFNAGIPLFEYVFSHYVTSIKDFKKQVQDGIHDKAPRPPVNDKAIKVDLTIDSAARVTVHEITGSPRLGSLRRRRLKKKLEHTSGMWIPASENGVSRTSRLTMTFVRRGNFSLKFRNQALKLFKKSYASMKKEQYPQAIQQVTEAINLVDDKFQFYVLRAVCHLRMEDLDKYCEDVQKAHSLNPFVALTNIESVNGESIEISCGIQ